MRACTAVSRQVEVSGDCVWVEQTPGFEAEGSYQTKRKEERRTSLTSENRKERENG